MDDSKQTRRAFCTRTCRAMSVAALGGALASVLESCSSGSSPTSSSSVQPLPTTSGTTNSTGALVVTVDSSSPLATVGNAALVEYPGGYLLVARTASSSFVAVSGICTHQSCVITGRNGQNYFCPCHGSQFDTSGHVLVGPAAIALRQFTTQFDPATNTLTITA